MKNYRAVLGVFLMGATLLSYAAPAYGAFSAVGTVGQLNGGNPSFTLSGSNNSPNTEGFNYVVNPLVDQTGNRLFVYDGDNNRVLVFNLAASGLPLDRTADYVLGQPDFNSNIALAPSASSIGVGDGYYGALAYDSAGSRLFVADGDNNRVLVFNLASITNGEAAVNVLGQPDLTTVNPGSDEFTLQNPYGLAYDGGGNRLFVADTTNNRVVVFDVASITNGEAAVNVLGQPDFVTVDPGTTDATFSGPYHLAYDATDSRLFVGDRDNNRALVFDVASITNGEAAVNVLGQPDFVTVGTTPNATTTASSLSGLAYDDANDRLFTADGYGRIMVFDVATSSIANGEAATHIIGKPDFESLANSPTPTSTEAGEPVGLSFHSAGQKLYVADAGGNRVMIFDVAPGTLADYPAAVDLLGQVDSDGSALYIYDGADNGPNAGTMNLPFSAVVDTQDHRLFVSDQMNHRVLVFNLTASNNLTDFYADYVLGHNNFRERLAGVSATEMRRPRGLAIDVAGRRLFVADSDNNRILVFNLSSLSSGMAASNVLGQSLFTTRVNTNLLVPHDIDYDAVGQQLFVADWGHNRVLTYNVASITDGESSVGNIGTVPSPVSNVSSSTLYGPTGVAYDSERGRLFVSDTNSNRILVFVYGSGWGFGQADYVLGQPDFTSSASSTTATTLYSPMGLGYDAGHNRLYVTDTNNSRVLGYDVATITSGEAATVVLGQSSFTSNTAGASALSLSVPEDVFYDSDKKRLYVVDYGNNRVVSYDHIKLNPKSLPAATVNQAYHEEFDVENAQGSIAYTLADGSLPPGMTLGSVDGTPTAPGTYMFTVQAQDTVAGAGNLFDDQTFTLVVNPAPAPPGGGSAVILSSGGGGGGGPIPQPSTPTTGTSTASSSVPATTTLPLAGPALPNFNVPFGTTSPVVRLLQQFLNSQGFTVAISGPGSPGNETDYFGPATRAALARYYGERGDSGNVAADPRFTKNLRRGDSHTEVKLLQQFLNSQGFTVAISGPGSPGNETDYFGPATAKAVSAFQEKYASEILTPSGLAKGNGYFGPATRALANKLWP